MRRIGTDPMSYIEMLNSILETDRKYYESYAPKYKQITVVGVGGAGCNIVTRLMRAGVPGIHCIAINTDRAHLENKTEAHEKILIGEKYTDGLGTGGDPVRGRMSAEEDIDKITRALGKPELVFVAAGLGGGTGTGAGPVIAKVAKERGSIVLPVVVMPLSVEKRRVKIAEKGLNEFLKYADTVAIIRNDKLLAKFGHLPASKALEMDSLAIAAMIKGFTEFLNANSRVNIDMMDVRRALSKGGVSAICIGEGSGRNRVEEALYRAFSNPLIDFEINGAKAALVSIKAGLDVSLNEIFSLISTISEHLEDNGEVKWGFDSDESLESKIRVVMLIIGVKSPDLKGIPFERDKYAISSFDSDRDKIIHDALESLGMLK